MTQLPLKFSDSPGINGEMVDMALRVNQAQGESHASGVVQADWVDILGFNLEQVTEISYVPIRRV